MKKHLLILFSLFISSAVFSQECSEIFISEYVEGWSNNKAIELYNPTDQSVDLSGYQLKRYSNGSSSAGSTKVLTLSGIMEPLSVYVIVIDKRDPDGEGQEAPVWDELQEKADVFECPIYDENNVMYFNGNDAMILFSTGFNLAIDRVGKIGEDPGNPSDGGGWNDVGPNYTWASNGATAWTANHSLIRKPDIQIGDFFPTNTFNVSEQWDSIPPVVYNEDGIVTGGNWESLGQHLCDCGDVIIDNIDEFNPVEITFYPNPSTQGIVELSSKNPITNLSIYAINGELMEKVVNLNTLSYKLNTSEYLSGVYLVNLKFSNGYVVTKRLIVK